MTDHGAQGKADTLLFQTSLLAMACLLGVLALPMLSGKMFVFDDLGAYSLPLRSFYSDCLQNGHSFHWFPGAFCGVDLHGEGQVGLYHPLHDVLYRFLSLTAAFNLEMLLSDVMAMSGMYLFCRRLSFLRGPSALGALVFGASGFYLLHHVHLNMISVVAHVPWNLLFLTFLLDAGQTPRRRLLAGAALALSTTSQVLLGYPQMLWLSGLTEAVFVVSHVGRGLMDGVQRLLFLVWAKLCGVGMGLLQLMPTWESLRLSVRDGLADDFVYSFSTHPFNLIQILCPYFFDDRIFGDMKWGGNPHEAGIYGGALSLVALFVLLCHRRSMQVPPRLFRFIVILVGVGGVLALGWYGGVYRVQAAIPLLDSFRCPGRYILLTHLGLALAGVATVQAALVLPTKQWPLWTVSRYVVLLAVLAAVLAFSLGNRQAWLLGGGAVAFVATSGLLIYGAKTSKSLLALLPLVVLLDQGGYGLSYLYTRAPMTLSDFKKSLPRSPDSVGRILSTNGLTSALPLTLLGHHLTGGYMGLSPRFDVRQNSHDLIYSRARWRLDEVPGGGLSWRRVDRDTVPRSGFLSPKGDSSEVVDAQGVEIVNDDPGRIGLSCHTKVPRTLFVSERYHPGWTVTVDGQAAVVRRIRENFIGCDLEPGGHRVLFSFEPQSFRRGVAGSAASLLLFGLSLGVLWWRSSPGERA